MRARGDLVTRARPDDVAGEGDVLTGRSGARTHAWPVAGAVRRWAAAHRIFLSRSGVAVAVPAAVLAVATALPSHEPSPPALRAVGLSIRIADSGAPMAGSIVASYRVVDATPGDRWRVRRVSGPFLDRVRPIPGDGGGRGTVVRLAGTPRCDDASLEAGPGRYLLSVTSAGEDGRTTRSRLPVPASPADWGSAIRETCWAVRARQEVTVVGLRVRPLPRQGLVQLAVRLTSAMPTAVQVRAVDIADVSTVDAADSRVLLPGVPRVVHVRVPVRDCAVPPAPQDLTWVVGPPRGDPAATFATPLDPADQRSVTVAAERACRPPATQVRAVAARLLPEDQVLVDPSGIGLAVRIRVVSPLARVSLGPDTGPLTADARTSLSHAEVRTVHGRGSAVVVWRTTCGPGAAPPPLLPVRFGDHPAYAVVLRDAVLARAYAEACRLSYPDSLRPQGWRAG